MLGLSTEEQMDTKSRAMYVETYNKLLKGEKKNSGNKKTVGVLKISPVVYPKSSSGLGSIGSGCTGLV